MGARQEPTRVNKDFKISKGGVRVTKTQVFVVTVSVTKKTGFIILIPV